MILYKYFPIERIDVLQNLKIRFSQPDTYNDPFELNPILNSGITETDFNNIMPALIKYHGVPGSELDNLKETTFLQFQSDPSLVLKCIQRIWASGHLVLCLSSEPDNLLMWAHYAGAHEGFALGLDSTHTFLTCPKGSYWPKKIVYREDRPTVIVSKIDFDSTGAYFTKSTHWGYEDEYRVIRKPDGIDPLGVDRNNFPKYFFDLPADAIKEVVLGFRCSDQLMSQIEQMKNEKFPHAVIRRVSLSNNEFKIIIV